MRALVVVSSLVLTTLGLQGQELGASPGAGSDSLALTRTLYAAADYERALASVPPEPAPADWDDADRYRALCLLALGRTAEADSVFALALTRDPHFRVTAGEVAPRVVDFFHGVLERVLPPIAEQRYHQARAEFDAGRYREAEAAFGALTDLVSDNAASSVSQLSELRRLSEDFRLIAHARSIGAQAPSPVMGVRPSPANGDDADGDAIYTSLSPKVQGPVFRDRALPPFVWPRDQEWRTFRGVIEVTIDDRGVVQRAQMLEALAPFYDPLLIAAAKEWQFRPAQREGHTVWFRQRIEIIIRPDQTGELRLLAALHPLAPPFTRAPAGTTALSLPTTA